jgi:hypothetical protein
VTVSPASFPISLRMSAFIGHLCLPSPSAMNELSKASPSTVPRTFTRLQRREVFSRTLHDDVGPPTLAGALLRDGSKAFGHDAILFCLVARALARPHGELAGARGAHRGYTEDSVKLLRCRDGRKQRIPYVRLARSK